MIENERNPSWVPLVTLFLPVGDSFYGFFDTLKAPGTSRGPFHICRSNHSLVTTGMTMGLRFVVLKR